MVRPAEVVVVLGGAALLAGSWIAVAASDVVPAWEVTLFEQVNGLPGAPWPIAWVPMQLGSFAGSVAVAGAAAVATRNPRLGMATLVAGQAAFWTAKLVKSSAGRGRPRDLLPSVELREHASGLGYVSGHAAVAFALGAALLPSLPPRWRPVAAAVAVVVASARVYGGVHLPLDVIGGAGIGLLLGTFSRWAFGLGGEGIPAVR